MFCGREYAIEANWDKEGEKNGRRLRNRAEQSQAGDLRDAGGNYGCE